MKVGVNGFGRIGRYFTRMALASEAVQVAMVNDLSDIQTLAHLFKYDSIHGINPHTFVVEGNALVFENGKRIVFTAERDPAQIPWSEESVQLVLESTGLFRERAKAAQHLGGSVKKVIISAPASDLVDTVVLGVNEQILDSQSDVISNASCTTNNAAPMLQVLKQLMPIDSAYITTIHSYTTDQKLHDSPHKDLRRARAAGNSIVPTSTGAAKALTKIFPDLDGKIGGCGIRVPVHNGSMTDITIVTQSAVEIDVINAAMKQASEGRLKGILGYTEDPIVSVDILGNPLSCLFDAQLTSVIGNMVKVVGWYDNEAGYSNRLLDLMTKLEQSFN